MGVIVGKFCIDAWYSAPKIDGAMVTIVVVPDESFASVAKDLEEQGVVTASWLRLYAKFFDDAKVFPGTYKVVVGASYRAILQDLRGGEAETVRLTIPEGFSLVQIGERVHEALPDISMESWKSVTGVGGDFENDAFVIASSKLKSVDLEGYLFPDTYEFSVNATAHDVANTMLRAMEKHVHDLGDVTGDADHLSVHELLTLASIVEKEVRTPESMGNVADIFLKRLAINMALQADSTVNYVIHGTDPSVSLDDTKIDSPYNTYKHPGLPPGPISSPSLNALTAVFHPIHNDYYYFLTTDSGEIYYAETFEEHVRNKGRYLR